MAGGFIVRLLPKGPWRVGPDNGAERSTDDIYHSDSLYSAVCSAMLRLGVLEEWLEATARNGSPAVRFSSAFPWMDSHLYVPPPRTHWPLPASTRLRSTGARFIPLSVVRELLGGRSLEEDRWEIDGGSGCLAPRQRRSGQAGPFRRSLRSRTAVDRLAGGGASLPHQTGCLEFAPNAGYWFAVEFASQEAEAAWWPAIQTAIRWLADSGFGGKRTLGWGHCEIVEIQRATLGELIATPSAQAPPPSGAEASTTTAGGEESASERPSEDGAAALGVSSAQEPERPKPVAEASHELSVSEPDTAGFQTYWLLSLYNPSALDEIDWRRGSYSFRLRGGRVESPAGAGRQKRQLRMVEEGSVLFARRAPEGRAVDVAPPGHPHPVYRAGFALAVATPWRVNA